MARKGVLVSNPDVKNMTSTMWMFEFNALKRMEESTLTAFKNIMVSMLGLNMLRPTSENGIPKSHSDMTTEEQEAFLPLITWCGRPELLKMVTEQMEAEAGMAAALNPDKAYEDMVAAIDAANGDMDPIVGIDTTSGGKYKDPKIEQQQKLFVTPAPTVDVDGKV